MVTRAELNELYPRAPAAHLDAFATGGDELLDRFGIAERPERLYMFLAQIGHELGGLTITEENLNYRAERLIDVWPRRFTDVESGRPFEHNPEALADHVYCDRMGNGPESSGDGWRYRGRGYIQITGRDGYQSVGDIAGLDLVGEPDLAAAPQHALLVACAFWQWKDLNPLCAADGIEAVTRRINGGLTGLRDRRAWLDKVHRTLDAPPAINDQPTAAEVVAVQRALQALGYTELGAADGLVGRRTLAAITRFREENGLPPGGIDQELLTALEVV